MQVLFAGGRAPLLRWPGPVAFGLIRVIFAARANSRATFARAPHRGRDGELRFGSNCGAPLFPFRDCDLADFAELTSAGMTFGDPTEGDRCVSRPSRREGWTFARVPPSAELFRALDPRP